MRVTVVPAPPAVLSATKVTSRTNVFFCILYIDSFNLSIAEYTVVLVPMLVTAPSFNAIPVPIVDELAKVLIAPVTESTYALLAASVLLLGVAKPRTEVAKRFAYLAAGDPRSNVFVDVGTILVLTDAPKVITSPPSPSLIALPLSVIAPLTDRLFLIDTLFACIVELLARITEFAPPSVTVKPLLRNTLELLVVNDTFAITLAAKKFLVFNSCVLTVPTTTFC